MPKRIWPPSIRQCPFAGSARAAISIAAFFCCGSAISPPIRLALVIGNGNYAHSVPLPNALSDARRVAERLHKLGFQVREDTLDLNQKQLAQTITDFGKQLKAAGPNVVSFIYYSGHAAQDAFQVNYLLPVDAKSRNPKEIRGEGTSVQLLLQAMEDADNDVNIIVLDACRDWYKGERTPQDPKGLHDMGLHASILFAFATRADDVADEGANLDSSPYSHRLIEALNDQSSSPVASIFDEVQGEVYNDTNSEQLPIFVDGLVRAGRWSFTSAALANVRDKPLPAKFNAASPSFLDNLDKSKLLKFARMKETFVDTLMKRRDILNKYDINTPVRLAQFLAAIAYETAGFKYQIEKFGYEAGGLRRTFPSRVTTDGIAHKYAGHPEMAANFVYANLLGNGPESSGDGWRYRGRGLFFLTGRGNYRRYGQEIGVDLENSPDLVDDPETGFAAAAAIWKTTGANAAADQDDVSAVARHYLGVKQDPAAIAERKIWLAQAKTAVARQ